MTYRFGCAKNKVSKYGFTTSAIAGLYIPYTQTVTAIRYDSKYAGSKNNTKVTSMQHQNHESRGYLKKINDCMRLSNLLS